MVQDFVPGLWAKGWLSQLSKSDPAWLPGKCKFIPFWGRLECIQTQTSEDGNEEAAEEEEEAAAERGRQEGRKAWFTS